MQEVNTKNNLVKRKKVIIRVLNIQIQHQQIVNKIKLIFLILLITFSLNSYSQSFEELKKMDTIYIYFKNSSDLEKKEIYKNMKVERFNRICYKFSLDFYNTIFFNSSEYKDYDSYEKGIKNDVIIVKKSFLRKNKEKIIDIDFFIKNGFKETFFLLYGKIIYLIDEEEIKNRKVLIKQVQMDSNYIEE